MALVVFATVMVMLVINSINATDPYKSDDKFVTHFDRLTVDISGTGGLITFSDISEHRNGKDQTIFWMSKFSHSGQEYGIVFYCIEFNSSPQFSPTFAFVENMSSEKRYTSLSDLPIDASYVKEYISRMCGASKVLYLSA